MWSHNEPAPQVEARIVIVLCEATIRRRRQPNSVFAERGYILGRQPKWCKLAAVAGVLWPALVPGSVAVMVRLKSDCVGQRGLAAVMAWLARRGCSPAAAGLLPHSPRLPPGAGGLVAHRPLGALACQRVRRLSWGTDRRAGWRVSRGAVDVTVASQPSRSEASVLTTVAVALVSRPSRWLYSLRKGP